MFGTDEANNGGLLARETMRNNISDFEWEGDKLRVTNQAVVKFLFLGFSCFKFSSIV